MGFPFPEHAREIKPSLEGSDAGIERGSVVMLASRSVHFTRTTFGTAPECVKTPAH